MHECRFGGIRAMQGQSESYVIEDGLGSSLWAGKWISEFSWDLMRFPGFWIPTATKGKLFRRTSRTKVFPAMPGGHSNSARYNPRTGEIDEDWRRCQHQELGVWELSTPPRRPADGRFFPNEYGQIHFPHSPFLFLHFPFLLFSFLFLFILYGQIHWEKIKRKRCRTVDQRPSEQKLRPQN